MNTSRRAFVSAAAVSLSSTAFARAPKRTLDLSLPADTLTAWMKLHTSLDEADLYYWYRCRIDGAMPGRPIVTLCGYDTLYRFQVRPQPDGVYLVTRWETSFYTNARTDERLDEMVNPFTGELVRPMHFKEGPVTFRYSTQRPYIIGSPIVRSAQEPFALPWVRVGDDVWATNETFVDFSHPLQPEAFPRSSSGKRLMFSNISTIRGSMAELENPSVRSATCRLSYQATSGWSPWLLMGQSPGHVVLRGQGAKFANPADLPAGSRKTFEALHPQVFQRDPWSERKVMLADYGALRTRTIADPALR
jgi:hypothetical protein